MAGKTSTRVLLVTANIASCFEQPDTMLKPWITEFLKTVEDHEPQFIALHCQEVGGKNYEESMQHVEHFVRSLLNRGTMLPYDKIRVFLDEEYESAEKFTALGNLYFIHQNVQDVQIWDFEEKKFVDCLDRREYSGNIEDVPTKEKSKFPQEFFPECKWSRKGFMRTRWCLNGSKFDLVNIHLFHDASNFIAMEEFPSVYSLNRKRALEHTLDRFHNDAFENVPLFIFGDFNFRVNTHGVVQKLTNGCTPEDAELPNTGEKAKEYKDNKGKVQLTISKKTFRHSEHDTMFLKDNGSLLKEFDQEIDQFKERLTEFPISFPPSYPFEEGAGGNGSHYMKTRCPSWCDRIILDKAAKKLVDSSNGKVSYNLIGLNVTMGDHKPVGLCLEVAMGADDGTPVDEPVWQLREPGETTAVSEQPTPLEEESDPAKGTLRCVPQGIVSTRYLTSPTATPDSHIHVFRETTV
ncbi:inositol polyphosphate-5-phosphatase A-like isoform X3 [Penaeus japonicus]|uniref:inositol polyphosphate-5-phosphatase A-like isoform X3 n=1 Tax=Penaeus japonicus TaxID=27405 RepID=UPI001C70B328|nr:inositol polyphosphate-5-phosphatase A-like isoform X3 [Penaeus japonicus]